MPLSSLASVSVKEAPASITTIKGVQSATITVTPKTDDTGTASSSIAKAIKATRLPGGSSATLGGVTTQQNEAFSQLFIALLAAILTVYIVMVAAFKSLRQPLLLLASIPFAATGAIVLQKLSGIPLGVASLIGVLMLVGVVVTNAIVLVDLVNQYRRRGYAVFDSIVHGGSRRLRPILMTALATIFALLPMGLGITGSGGFISQPLAIIVIGGLVSSTPADPGRAPGALLPGRGGEGAASGASGPVAARPHHGLAAPITECTSLAWKNAAMRFRMAWSSMAIECSCPATVTKVTSTPAARSLRTKAVDWASGMRSSVEWPMKNGGSPEATSSSGDAAAACGQEAKLEQPR
ncbi:MAG: efflux RND transporter permease subunit [Galbitalea sp.]